MRPPRTQPHWPLSAIETERRRRPWFTRRSGSEWFVSAMAALAFTFAAMIGPCVWMEQLDYAGSALVGMVGATLVGVVGGMVGEMTHDALLTEFTLVKK